MKRLALILLAAFSSASASAYSDLITALERAQRRVLVFAPSLYDVELANTLRRARLDSIRKVDVRVLSVPYYNYQPRSVMLSLSLAGVPVYEAQVPSTEGLIVVDDQGWRGDGLGRFTNAALVPITTRELNTALNWFKSSLKGANVLTQAEAFDRLKKVTP